MEKQSIKDPPKIHQDPNHKNTLFLPKTHVETPKTLYQRHRAPLWSPWLSTTIWVAPGWSRQTLGDPDRPSCIINPFLSDPINKYFCTYSTSYPLLNRPWANTGFWQWQNIVRCDKIPNRPKIGAPYILYSPSKEISWPTTNPWASFANVGR